MMSDCSRPAPHPFKACSSCERGWTTRDQFLSDAAVVLVGYQVDFRNLKAGLFLFNHLPCKTTLAIPAGEFQSLYNGPVFTERLTDTEACSRYCQHQEELRPCPAQCECAFVREVLQVVRDWRKKNGNSLAPGSGRPPKADYSPNGS